MLPVNLKAPSPLSGMDDGRPVTAVGTNTADGYWLVLSVLALMKSSRRLWSLASVRRSTSNFD